MSEIIVKRLLGTKDQLPNTEENAKPNMDISSIANLLVTSQINMDLLHKEVEDIKLRMQSYDVILVAFFVLMKYKLCITIAEIEKLYTDNNIPDFDLNLWKALLDEDNV